MLAGLTIGGDVANSSISVGSINLVGGRSSEARGGTLSAQHKDDIRTSYLAWMVSNFANLPAEVTINGQPIPMPLEHVFVSLRGYPGSASEIGQVAERRTSDDRYEAPSLLTERNVPRRFSDDVPQSADLGEAFRQHRAMVVLGDPGSGKTTMAWWLALAFANAGANERARVVVPERALDPGSSRPDGAVDLGVTRIPIYRSVASLAQAYRARNRSVVLADLLAEDKPVNPPVYITEDERHGERIHPADLVLLFKDALRTRRAVVILDGLDEVADPDDRADMVKLIHGFLDSHFKRDDELGNHNQLLVTSRIIGYESNPLRDEVSRYTIERLSEPMMGEFIDCWHTAYAKQLAAGGQPPEQAGRIASAAFKAQIFAPEREALRDLGSNPFMLSLLCVLNQEHGQQLPSSRASVYEMLVERGLRRLFDEKRIVHRQLGGLVRDVLMALAHRMQTATTNALMPRREMEEFIWSAVRRDRAGANAVASSEEAFRLVVQSVGLLDERGRGQYRFKHLTIQEYLAGKYLVRDESAAAGNLIRNTTDPRWREVVLLGLGSLCNTLPQDRAAEICRGVAAARAGRVPVGAIVVAQVIGEFASVPLEIVGDTVEALLASYVRIRALRADARLGAFIEASVGDLLIRRSFPRPWRSAAERACLRFAKAGGDEHVRALAWILHTRRIAVPFLAETLLSALHSDGEHSEWIVNRTLEAMVSSGSHGNAALKPVTDDVCRRLSAKTLETLRNDELIGAIRYTPAARTAVAQRDTEIPAHLLPFREALGQMPEALELIRKDLHWLRLVSALYGGLGSFGTPDLRDALEKGRLDIISAIGAETDAARTGQLLDTDIQPRWERLKAMRPDLDARRIYRDSPLTPLLVRWLDEKRPLRAALPQLRALWRDPRSQSLASRYRETAAGARLTQEEATEVVLADVLLALMACSAIDGDELLSLPVSSLHEKALRRFTSDLRRIVVAERDPLLRLREPLQKVLEVFAAADLDEPPGSARSVDDITVDLVSGGAEQLELAADPLQAAEQLRELWAVLVRTDAESSRRMAIVLDTCGERLSRNPKGLFRSWQSLLDRRFGSSAQELEAACARIAIDDADVALAACVAGIDRLPSHFEHLKAFALSRLAPLVVETPHLAMIAAALALTLSNPVHRRTALAALYGDGVDERSIRHDVGERIAATPPQHAIVAFRALRYADRLDDERWRRALLQSASRVQPARVRAAALLQTAIVLRSCAEGSIARDALTTLLPDLEGTPEWAVLDRILVQLDSSDRTGDASLASTWRDVARFLEAFRADAPSPLACLRAQGSEAQAALVVEVIRTLFLNELAGVRESAGDPDSVGDRPYSIAVTLDASGKALDLAPDVLIAALARSLPLADELRWDTFGLLPSRAASQPSAELNALSFIAAIPAQFDNFAAWALSRIGRHIARTSPDWTPLLATLAARIGDAHRGLAMLGVDERRHAISQEGSYAGLRREALAISEPFVRFHTLRMLSATGIPVAVSAVLDAASGIGDERTKALALLDCLLQFGIDRTGRVAPADVEPHGERDEQRIVSSASQLRATVLWLEARAPLIDDAQQLAALASILNGLDVKRLSMIQPSLSEVPPWDELADAPRRPDVFARLAARGLAGDLPLDDRALEALRAWTARGDEIAPLESILPLVSSGAQSATQQLQTWFANYPSAILGEWACVMLAERGRWSGTVLNALIDLLHHDNDLLRNRAAVAISMTKRFGRKAQSSGLGDDTVSALACALLRTSGVPPENERVLRPAALTSVRWSFMQIVVDTDGLLTRLRDDYVERANQAARGLYGQLNYVSASVRAEIASLLRGDLPPKLRANLIASLVLLWERSWYLLEDGDPILGEIRAHLWGRLEDESPEVRQAAQVSLGYISGPRDVARLTDLASPSRVAHLRMLATNIESPVSFARPLLEAPGGVFFQSLLELLGTADEPAAIAAGALLLRGDAQPEDVRERLHDDDAFLDACFASVDFHFVGAAYLARVRHVARGIVAITARQTTPRSVDETHLFVRALVRANDLMASGHWLYRSVDLPTNLYNVLPVCAAAAEMMPDLYRSIVERFLPDGFEQQLAVAMYKGESFVVREAALVLLALLRRFSVHMSRALRAAGADVYDVQQVAIGQIVRLREIELDALPELECLLESPSANMGYVAVRTVMSALRNRGLKADERRRLEEWASAAFAAAAQNVAPHKIVSLLESHENTNAPRIRNVGPLKHVLDGALLELSSVHLGPSAQEHSAFDVARVLVRARAGSEPYPVDVLLGESAVSDTIPNQRTWLEKVLRLTIPQDVTDALNDVQGVAREAGVSCAALADAAQRLVESKG